MISLEGLKHLGVLNGVILREHVPACAGMCHHVLAWSPVTAVCQQRPMPMQAF
jgi:hypothetical protein